MTLNLINQGTDAEFTTNAKMKKQRPKPFKQKPAASPYKDSTPEGLSGWLQMA